MYITAKNDKKKKNENLIENTNGWNRGKHENNEVAVKLLVKRVLENIWI